MDEYKKLSKQFKKQKRSDALGRLAHKTRRINPYPRLKYKYLTKKNIAPDISTITENIAFVIDTKSLFERQYLSQFLFDLVLVFSNFDPKRKAFH